VYDAATGRAAPALERTSQWLPCANRREAPPVAECDLDGDGRLEIVFPQFDHNGTVVNTDVQHYFAIDEKPELHPLLELQDDQWISVVSDGEDGFVRRALHTSSRGGLRVLIWYENPCLGSLRVPIGVLGLTRLPSGFGYRDDGSELVLPGAEDYLQR
jgi:hypothetical protein